MKNESESEKRKERSDEIWKDGPESDKVDVRRERDLRQLSINTLESRQIKEYSSKH